MAKNNPFEKVKTNSLYDNLCFQKFVENSELSKEEVEDAVMAELNKVFSRNNIMLTKAYEKLSVTMQEYGSMDYIQTVGHAVAVAIPIETSNPYTFISDPNTFFQYSNIIGFLFREYWEKLEKDGRLVENASNCAKNQAHKNAGIMFPKIALLMASYLKSKFPNVQINWEFESAKEKLSRAEKIAFIVENSKMSATKLNALDDKDIDKRYKQIKKDLDLMSDDEDEAERVDE